MPNRLTAQINDEIIYNNDPTITGYIVDLQRISKITIQMRDAMRNKFNALGMHSNEEKKLFICFLAEIDDETLDALLIDLSLS